MIIISNCTRYSIDCRHNYIEVNVKKSLITKKEQSSIKCSSCGKVFPMDLVNYFSYDQWLWLATEHSTRTNAQPVYIGDNKYNPICYDTTVLGKFLLSKKLWIKFGRIYVK